MEAVAAAGGEDQLTDDLFGLGVIALHPAHHR